LTREGFSEVSKFESVTEQKEFREAMKQVSSSIESLWQANDLVGVERLAEEIHMQWVEKNPQYHASLLLQICSPLSSGSFGDSRQYALSRKYALWALADPNEISIETEVKLTGHGGILSLPEYGIGPQGQEFVKHRTKDMQVRFHAWKRLNDAIDLRWDPTDVPYVNVPLPPGVSGIRPGGSPAVIKDPKLRAQYEAAIEKNWKKAERYRIQYRSRQLKEHLEGVTQRLMVELYSIPPYNTKELERYLTKTIKNKATRDDIRKRINDRIAQLEIIKSKKAKQ